MNKRMVKKQQGQVKKHVNTIFRRDQRVTTVKAVLGITGISYEDVLAEMRRTGVSEEVIESQRSLFGGVK